MSKYEVLSLPPKDLIEFLYKNFADTVPKDVETYDDMVRARRTMLRLTAEYSYLMELLSCAKALTREYKRSGSKEEYEDAIDRKEIVSNCVSMVSQKYSGISRAVTIKQECNRELNMQMPA